MVNEAWKPLPECLADDFWPCLHYLQAASPNASVTDDPFTSDTGGGWQRVWVAHSVSHKPAQRGGSMLKAAGGSPAVAESASLADPSGEALALA